MKMDNLKDKLNKTINEIKTNPRKCDICGVVETVRNIILKYDNGLCMCDDCAMEYYNDFYE